MTLHPEQMAKVKPFLVISALYLPSFVLLSWISGHLHYWGESSLFFSSWTDADVYKVMADYYMSGGNSVVPSDFQLKLRPFVYPMFLGLYHVLGIAGVQALQLLMNTASLWLVFLSIKSLSNRSGIAIFSTALLAVTPSFNFLVFHAMTESLSILLVCVFIALIVEHYKNPDQVPLFWPAVVMSLLLCTRPIVFPFWMAFFAYYSISWLRSSTRSIWQPIVSITPVICQLTITLVMSGSPSLASMGGTVSISDWFFPRVYEANEYGRFTGRKSMEVQEGKRLYPDLKDKAVYLIKNYGLSLKMYLYILISSNLGAGSHYLKQSSESDSENNRPLVYLQAFSMYLNRFFVCIHVVIAALMVWLMASGRKIYEDMIVMMFYLFAAFLILPAGFVYDQGDRYILLASPLWLVAHSALAGLFLDLLKRHNEPRLQRERLLPASETSMMR